MKVFNNIIQLNSEVNFNSSWLFPKFTFRDIGLSLFFTLMFSSYFYIAPTKTTLALVPVVSMSLFPSWGNIINVLVFPLKITINIIMNPTSVINTIFKESYNYSSNVLSGVKTIIALYTERWENKKDFNPFSDKSEVLGIQAKHIPHILPFLVNNDLPKIIREEMLFIHNKTENIRKLGEDGYLNKLNEYKEEERLLTDKINYHFRMLHELRYNSPSFQRYLFLTNEEGYGIFSKRVTDTLCRAAFMTIPANLLFSSVLTVTHLDTFIPLHLKLIAPFVVGIKLTELSSFIANDTQCLNLYSGVNVNRIDNYLSLYKENSHDVKKIKLV